MVQADDTFLEKLIYLSLVRAELRENKLVHSNTVRAVHASVALSHVERQPLLLVVVAGYDPNQAVLLRQLDLVEEQVDQDLLQAFLVPEDTWRQVLWGQFAEAGASALDELVAHEARDGLAGNEDLLIVDLVRENALQERKDAGRIELFNVLLEGSLADCFHVVHVTGQALDQSQLLDHIVHAISDLTLVQAVALPQLELELFEL